MILSDLDINDSMIAGKILIRPFDFDNLEPASYDLTLGYGFKKIEKEQIIKSEGGALYSTVNSDEFLLEPGGFILATTEEKVSLNNEFVAHLSGKSSWGRKGLKIENAGFIDPGFSGNITLEILNEGDAPILLERGVKICQIEFSQLKSPSINSYNGKYKNQKGVTGAK